ncbi:calcium-activated chloride channel regulator 1-like isoform X2 [Hyperolius riggenbachi]|uniref:calcium-activated chloride channel regulator 1-like isoform X2 n=1 Tax=Hyperolius riggenbachi TaxID=752182 RepID=UPI0035A319FF
MKIAGIILLACVLHSAIAYTAKDSLVTLKNNGYEDIVIAIHPKIPENGKLITNIKKMMTEASTYMLQATQNRVYIRSCKILIPTTWASNSTFGRPKIESYDKADIIVADPFIKGDDPYTLQYGGCGEQGKYIHLTPNFMLNDRLLRMYGSRGRVFVHEWAHLRWGVFDEYNNDEPFYLSGQGAVEATRCPLSLKGVAKIDIYVGTNKQKVDCEIDETGIYEEGCEFFPNVDPNVRESVMYAQALDPVHEFCKKDSHNKEAPNDQNRLCNQMSSWEVIMKSPDMTSSAPVADPNIPAPTFSLLQYKDRVVTLVLDVSGSMSGSDRIGRLYQASEVYIMQIVESGSYVGIVIFNNDAQTKSELVKITDTFQREQLKSLLPKAADGGTNICSGVRQGFQVNKQRDGSTYGTEIVLLTDGEDGGISSCFGEVEASGAIIHTVALGNSADKALEQLSDKTGGLKLFASDKVDANGLIDSFSGIKSSSGDVTAQSIQIESTAKTALQNECMTGTVTIDSTVGNDTFFLVTWSISTPNIQLTSPKGTDFQNDKFTVDATSKSARLTIPGTAEQGDWQYKICNTFAGNQVIGITVNSKAADPNLPPIIVETFLNADTSAFPTPMIVYCTVTQGFAPVLGAKVTAYIESQNGKITTLQLLDNGAGADIRKDDGTYCRYFTDYNANGRYSVKTRVENTGKDANSGVPKSRALYLPGFVENETINGFELTTYCSPNRFLAVAPLLHCNFLCFLPCIYFLYAGVDLHRHLVFICFNFSSYDRINNEFVN